MTEEEMKYLQRHHIAQLELASKINKQFRDEQNRRNEQAQRNIQQAILVVQTHANFNSLLNDAIVQEANAKSEDFMDAKSFKAGQSAAIHNIMKLAIKITIRIILVVALGMIALAVME